MYSPSLLIISLNKYLIERLSDARYFREHHVYHSKQNRLAPALLVLSLEGSCWGHWGVIWRVIQEGCFEEVASG